jgi:hypothetical protein
MAENLKLNTQVEIVELREDNIEYVAKATKRSEKALQKLLRRAQIMKTDVLIRIGNPW